MAHFFVMPGHSRPKDAVASLAYVPGIHVLFVGNKKVVGGRDKPGHDGDRLVFGGRDG